jgi:tRNA(fMet)-specific endonuclease VapC
MTGYLVSGRSAAARDRLEHILESAPILVSTITEAEVLYGLERNPQATRVRAAVAQLFATIQIRAWDSEAARAYGRLRTRLEKAGTPLEDTDLMIAAHAYSLGAVLVTHDKDFRYVAPYVTLQDWATDIGSRPKFRRI